MKYLWYYVKQMFMPVIYTIFASMIALGIICIEGDNLNWLKIILLILNIGLFLFIIAVNYFKEGQTEYKVRIANDVERENIIRTGDNRPLKLVEEYKPWKGYVIGLTSCAPLIILLLIHTIMFLAGSKYMTVGGLASSMYMFVMGFMFLDLGAETTATAALPATAHYLSLVIIPVMVVLVGVAYRLGARKIELQQQMIKEKHRQIYGE